MSAPLTAREKLLRAVTERQFQRQVEGFLNLYGWRFYHAPDNVPRNGHAAKITPGFPDLCAVRGRRMLYAELKREAGRTTADQDAWLADLAVAGAETYVWRPRDLEQIRATLAPNPSRHV